jgi:predicted chitinase
MIISPPFLIPAAQQPQPQPQPAQGGQNAAPDTLDQATQSAPAGNAVPPPNDVCDSTMQECAPGNGAFPVSFNLSWHGGAHLMAPRQVSDPTQYEPVRAIADGTIVYVRSNTRPTDNPATDPLQYANVRTDDGCVVIRHDTEIGEGDNAKITWFSIYLHLNPNPQLATDQKIYRKAVLGAPGMVYGQPGQIHFEQVCDTANLRRMVGRAPGPLGNTPARTDAVYGDIWFSVPSGKKLFANEPHPFRDDDENPPLGHAHSVQQQTATATTGSPLVIQMHYAGDCTMTTYQQRADGTWGVVGSRVDQDGEYNLYHTATGLNAKYTDGSLAEIGGPQAVPSSSVIFEMRRFGRLIQEQMPVGAEFNHWRQVTTPDGTGWINLSANEGIHGYSDADFPDWAGWSFIQDDALTTSHCDSPTIKKWLTDAIQSQGANADGTPAAQPSQGSSDSGASTDSPRLTHTDMVQGLQAAAVKARMAKAICKFSTEWAKTGLDDRYSWLKQSSDAWTTPLSEADFAALMNHANALAFWEEATGLPDPGDLWHFPATEFIRQFRKCFWLSPDELKRIYPDTYTRRVNGRIESAAHTLNDATRERYRVILNRLTEKHFVTKNACRMSHFYGQGAEESRTLASMNENRSVASCNTLYQNKNGNDLPGDGYLYRGRGMKQLTGKSNYADYWVYRGWLRKGDFTDSWWNYSETYQQAHNKHALHSSRPVIEPNINDPDRILNIHYNTIDASAWYWEATPSHGGPRDGSTINLIADAGVADQDIRHVTETINGGRTGLDNRNYHTQLIYVIFGDQP